MIRRANERQTEYKENMRGGEGTVTFHHLMQGDEFFDKGRMYAELRLPVGASIGRHTHEGESECYYVLSGAGAYEDNGVWRQVGPGDVTLTPPGEHHALRNDGPDELVVLALIIFA